MRRRAQVMRVGKRLAQGVGVLLLATGGLLAINSLVLSDDTLGPPPVRVQVLAPGTFESAHAYAPYYVVPSRRVANPSKLSRAASNAFVTRPEAALGNGALAGSPQVVRLELRATTNERVVLGGVRFHVVSAAGPLHGWFTAQPACAFERVPLARTDLDARRPAVRYVDIDGKSTQGLGLKLGRSTPTVLELHVATERRRVAWTATLSVSRDGAPPQKVTVDNGGEPFRVTSPRESRGYAPRFGATGISGFARRSAWDGGIKACGRPPGT
jgi:hypothetical protein